MNMVRMECYCPKKNGCFNPGALCVTFATRTPLVLYFYRTDVIAFARLGVLTVYHGGAPRRYMNEITSGYDEVKWCGSMVQLQLHLDGLITHFFEPKELDCDTHALIVADWLQERGLVGAAEIVRQNPDNIRG